MNSECLDDRWKDSFLLFVSVTGTNSYSSIDKNRQTLPQNTSYNFMSVDTKMETSEDINFNCCTWVPSIWKICPAVTYYEIFSVKVSCTQLLRLFLEMSVQCPVNIFRNILASQKRISRNFIATHEVWAFGQGYTERPKSLTSTSFFLIFRKKISHGTSSPWRNLTA